MNQRISSVVGGSLFLCVALPAFAQSDGAAQGANVTALEEIVVTARKRTESLLDVPLAISSFAEESLDRLGAASLEDVTLFAPGVQFQNQAVAIPGRYNSAVRFRGMATNLSQPAQQIGTVFVDGIWVSGSVFGLGFDDVERVEIIRGPQSALFGRSTFGGAVNYVTRTPGDDYLGRASAELGRIRWVRFFGKPRRSPDRRQALLPSECARFWNRRAI